MAEQKNTISLNGKLYDAKTGRLLGTSSRHDQTASSSHTHKGTVIDGFVRKHVAAAKPVSGQTQIKKPAAVSHAPARTAHTVHKKIQPAKTLMRSAVKRPDARSKHIIGSSHIYKGKPLQQTEPVLQMQMYAQRIERAKAIKKSNLISRFSTESDNRYTVVKKTKPLAVKVAPAETISQYHVSPVIENLAAIATEPIGTDFLANALQRAHSHEEPAPKRAKRRSRIAKRTGLGARSVNIAAAMAAIFVLGGFIAYQNAPNISLRMAAQKTGIRAALPGYRPSGFALDRSIRYSPGQVIINFQSNSDKRAFSISQSVSSWNSDTLLDTFVARNDQAYRQVSQASGRTVFLYGDANATWVDGGIWYRIEGDSSLARDQLLKIASSL